MGVPELGGGVLAGGKHAAWDGPNPACWLEASPFYGDSCACFWTRGWWIDGFRSDRLAMSA